MGRKAKIKRYLGLLKLFLNHQNHLIISDHAKLGAGDLLDVASALELTDLLDVSEVLQQEVFVFGDDLVAQVTQFPQAQQAIASPNGEQEKQNHDEATAYQKKRWRFFGGFAGCHVSGTSLS